MVNEDDFLELEEGGGPRMPGAGYAGRAYLPNLTGSRSSIDGTASVDSRALAHELRNSTSNSPSSGEWPTLSGCIARAG